MSLAVALRVTGTACQVVGIIIALWGVRELRATYTDRPNIERRIARSVDAVGRWFTMRWAAVRRLLRRMTGGATVQSPPMTATGEAHSRFTVTGTAGGFVTYERQPLHKPTMWRLDELDGRTRENRKEINRVASDLHAKHQATNVEIASIRDDMHSIRTDLSVKIRELGAKGLTQQTVGLGLTLAGVLFLAFS